MPFEYALLIKASNSDAAKPAPEAGTWFQVCSAFRCRSHLLTIHHFQAYFQTLVQNANPAL